ncbi:OLC1v1012664C1 [Oldenlandia corymbosa var. corymbosa]|uniref:OLC1v1012664C1 n=1 Tax=Oldenlandia corymbosa var. corymbosa TaxID=529605 RepID=A0AAV1DWH9_OLDCO|nr:OLC1v1012664C1 [Oldenlandia corymbosa var. corymbosa]
MEAELLSGFPLFSQQLHALLMKNLVLAWRNKKATFLRLFSPIFLFSFSLLLGGIGSQRENVSAAVRDPNAIFFSSIPACEDKLLINFPCYDFVWSGSGNQRFVSIVNAIMINNPNRTIHQNKAWFFLTVISFQYGTVKSFRTKKELNDWLLQNPMRTLGALHFTEENNEIRYGVQINSSSSDFKIGRQFEDPVLQFQAPLQFAASREISRSLIGDQNFRFNIGLKEFPHPPSEILSTAAGDMIDEILLIGIAIMFYFSFAMFGFMSQVHSLVREKELKLRQTMTIMGLYDSAYWSSWFIWEGLMSFLTSAVIVAFGALFRVDLFVQNSIVVVFILFFLLLISMVGFAFMISTLITKESSCTPFFSGVVYSSQTTRVNYALWSLFPPNAFAGALFSLASNPSDAGVGLKDITKCPDKHCLSINFFWTWLGRAFFLYSILAIYLDNIIPNSAGERKHLLYFLRPSYWTGREEIIPVGGDSTAQSPHFSLDDEDVREEEESVKQDASQGKIDPEVAVQLRGFAKSYTKTTSIRCHRFCFCIFCCTCKKRKPFDAVKTFWMNFPKDQLFCLLGPNGAGKSTIISCLTGIIPMTHGDALIYGNSIRSSAGMTKIRRMIGVSAQFDTLWDSLSGKDHLQLFANVKGLPPVSHRQEIQRLLAGVDIEKVANVRAKSYSGGTRRRLSLAIALIGDPKLVILDEPTTGMDPISRRRVWDVIENAKHGRSIILTTHSMVEADILSDRIGIMAKGRLRCIGTSTMLKSKFGAGYAAKVSFAKDFSNASARENDVNAERREAVKSFFKNRLNVEPKGENKYVLSFTLPNAGEDILADFFSELESRESQFGIKSIQLGLGTLEEVFLNIVKKAEQEEKGAAKKHESLTLPSGATVLVPVGAKSVKIPGTESMENPGGLMVEVFWDQDDMGNLCISSYSAKKPVAPNSL